MIWPPLAATGVGSWPGDRSREAATTIAGELPELPHLQELPSRGPGADLIGRTAALLAAVDSSFGIATTPSGWRLSGGMTAAVRRALSYLAEDLDYAQEQCADFDGTFKIQLCGPWTLAARLELGNGQRALVDRGACAELHQALGVAAAAHVSEVQRRLPHAQIVVQFDEPLLPAVAAARVPTPSGFATYRGIDTPDLTAGLERAKEQLTTPAGIHCCAPGFPIQAVRGFTFISFDILSARPDDREVSEAHDAGVGLMIGCVPVEIASTLSVERVSSPVRRYLADLGLGSSEYLDRVAISPVCGLAGSSRPKATLAAVRAVSEVLKDHDGQSSQRMIDHG